ncbi:MAG: R3H domain-containing nucleic acid-binding protein [Deltaproteobacteria bacterium]
MIGPGREEAPPPREAPEKVARARAFCSELLERLGASVDVEVRETPEAIGVSLTPRSGNAVELGGALVEALQALVNRVVNPRSEGRKWVNLEVGGFPEGADPATRAMALRLAEAARRTGQVLAVSPMSPRDRRAVHLALLDVEGVSTHSEGEGIFRQLLVVPGAKPKAPPAGG